MPLKQGSGQQTISANVKELIKSGRKPRQAVAIAMSEAGKSYRSKPMKFKGLNK